MSSFDVPEQELIYFQVSKYTTAVSLTVLVYDIFLTMDSEISMVWDSRWSGGKCLYFMTRYLTLVIIVLDVFQLLSWDLPVSTCKRSQLSATIIGIFVVTMIEGILILRTYALYPNKHLLKALITLAVVSLTTMLGCFAAIYHHEIFIPNTFGISGCIQLCVEPLCHPLLVAFWLPFFLLETIVFSLTAWRLFGGDCIKTLMTKFDKQALSYKKPRLLDVISRDGFIYYIVIIAMSVANMLIWLLGPFSLAYMGVAIMKSLQAIICSRLLLNIRDVATPRHSMTITLPNLMFSSPSNDV